MFMYLHHSSWHSSATLTNVFLWVFLNCKVNARVKPVKMGHGPHSSNFCIVLCIICFLSFCVLFVCKRVLYYCHRVATQLQLTNMSYTIILIPSCGGEWGIDEVTRGINNIPLVPIQQQCLVMVADSRVLEYVHLRCYAV